MTYKVVFIDIDGPMIPAKASWLPNQTTIYSVFDPIATAMVNRLLSDDPDLRIVISSSWGSRGLKKVSELFEKNGINPDKFHDDWITPRNNTEVRTLQIKEWLNAHPDVIHWCALDDERLDATILPNFVQCDTYNGISHCNYLECRYYLGMTNIDCKMSDKDNREKHWSTIKYYKRYAIVRTARLGDANFDAVNKAAHELHPMHEKEHEE